MQKERSTSSPGCRTFGSISISAEGTYHRTLTSASRSGSIRRAWKDEFVRLEDVGIHAICMKCSSTGIATRMIKFIDDWFARRKVSGSASGKFF